MPLDIVKYSPRVQKFFLLGDVHTGQGAQGPLMYIWDP